MGNTVLSLDLQHADRTPLAGAVVTVSYDREVRLSSGGTIPPLNSGNPVVVQAGTPPTVTVVQNDDPTVASSDQGFAVIVETRWTDPATLRPQYQRRTVSIGSAQGALVALSALADTQAVPVSSITVTPAQINQASTDASNALATANDAKNLAVTATTNQDSATANNINTGTLTQSAFDSRLTTNAKSPKLSYLNSYNKFITDSSFIWVSGQGNTATTAAASSAAGSTTLTVADATGLLAGVVLIMGVGTPQQQMVKISSVAGATLTLTAGLPYAVTAGDTVTPLWTNDRHLTAPGFTAFANFIANAKDTSGNYVLTGSTPKVTMLGNSWYYMGGTLYQQSIQARIPGATVINAGVSGNTSSQLLARFDTDVPTDSIYVVVNEPGVNDDCNNVPFSQQAANLEALWRKCRAIGATLVYVGHIPLQPSPTNPGANSSAIAAIIGDGSSYPNVTANGVQGGYPGLSSLTVTSSNSVGVGPGAIGAGPTGADNTAVGRNAASAVTTGAWNVAIGYAALAAATTSSQSVAIGILAGRYATGGSDVLIGYNANTAATTGSANVVIGHEAGHNVAGSTAQQTTTASGQVIVGKQAGGNSNYIVAIGRYAQATAQAAIALGHMTTAAFSGSVAIGCDNAGTGASTAVSNEIALGTALHTTRIRGSLQIDASQSTVGAAGTAAAPPTAPAKYLLLKDSTGATYAVPAYKAA